MAIWGPVIRAIAKIGAKIGARAGARTAGKAAGKTVLHVTTRTASRRLGLGIGIGALGTVGISNYLAGEGIFPSLFNAINPLGEDFNILIFGAIAIGLIAFFSLFRR